MADFFENLVKEIHGQCKNIDDFNKDILKQLGDLNDDVLKQLGKTNEEVITNLAHLLSLPDIKKPPTPGRKQKKGGGGFNPFAE